MTRPAPHLTGLLVTGAGVLVLSPDSLLVRLTSADPWTLLFWRGALLCAGITLPLVARRRSWRAPLDMPGRAGVLAAALLANSTICFVQALTHTSVANTLIIVGAGPLIAAALGLVFLHEKVEPRTWGAIVAAGAGIWLTVSGPGTPGRWVGDVCAGGTALSWAGYLVVLRHNRGRYMTPAVGLGGLLAALAVLPWARPFQVQGVDWLFLGLLGLVVLPVSFFLISQGPRYLPAPEVNLILLLEIVLGPYWVWLALGQAPEPRAMAGGAVVVATLALHSVLGLRAQGRTAARASGSVSVP